MFKRFGLFIALNLVVVLTVSFLLSVFNVAPFLSEKGLNIEALAIFCLIWGFAGAFISLALSRIMAKWTMGVKVIDPQSASGEAGWLVDTVYRLSKQAGLDIMPEVGIYNSPEVNAFATGPTKSRSLVAVSSGLLSRMNRDEAEGVLAHEVAHIANGDMVTMTLVQGVVNAFVMFLSRLIAYAVSMAMRGNNRDEGAGPNSLVFFVVTFVLEIVFMIIGSILVSAFSRHREYRADAGGAKLAGTGKMVAALEVLRRTYEIQDPQQAAGGAFQSFKISGRKGWLKLFSSHPPLEERIARLKASRV